MLKYLKSSFKSTLIFLQKKHCPQNKELNPKTRRCVKECKTNYTRNDLFKCVRTPKPTKTINPKKTTNPKDCPENKELNPKTGRCVKECKPNYTRNDLFKCVRTSKTKQKSNNSKTKTKKTFSQKECPENKELNPKTGRCVKKCKTNYTRNDLFKCVKNKTNP